jgi:uncharacterized membrane protein
MEEQNQQSNQQMPPQPTPAPSADQKDIEENKLWAFLGYLGILCLIPLLAKKDSKFAQFHAKQGLVMLIGWFFAWIPFVGWILGILLFVLWIMGIMAVFSGKMQKLPIVGDLAEKINI